MTQLPQKISSSGMTASSNPTGLNDSTTQLMQIAQPGKWASNLKIMIIIKSQIGSNDPMSQLTRWPQMSTLMQPAEMT